MSHCNFSVTMTADCSGGGDCMLAAFRDAVRDHYRKHGRDLPWRRTRDPYRILVSEVMLQQTQVARVVRKYAEFLSAFPNVRALALAPWADVLRVWQGLGYNRRALALHRSAQLILCEHEGRIPRSPSALRTLPGIGPATAGAVCAFAFDLPAPFVETNIRSALIHFFFEERTAVHDAILLPLVELTLDRENPRDWYYALMDYGARVKKTHPNPGRRSTSYTAQKPFQGSRRQLRAHVLRLLLGPPTHQPASDAADHTTLVSLSCAHVERRLPGWDPETVRDVLDELTDEGFLVRIGARYQIA